jgi:hypothetical protein
MNLSRRTLLKGMVATAAGLLLPVDVAAEPERRIWALDQTMVGRGAGANFANKLIVQTCHFCDPNELLWVQSVQGDQITVLRGFVGSGGTEIEIIGPATWGDHPVVTGPDPDNWMLQRLSRGLTART